MEFTCLASHKAHVSLKPALHLVQSHGRLIMTGMLKIITQFLSYYLISIILSESAAKDIRRVMYIELLIWWLFLRWCTALELLGLYT